MKNKRYYPMYVLTAISLLIFACDREKVETTDNGSLLIALKGVETRAGSIFSGDEEIGSLRVIVCAGNQVEKSQLFISGENDFVNPFAVGVTTGSKTIYVVANETATLTPQLSSIVSKAALEALLADPASGALTMPFVMTGKTGDGAVSVTAGAHNEVTVPLKRAVAKIKLQFRKETDHEVQITKVSLLNNTEKTPLFEGAATVTGQGYWVYQYPFTSEITLTDQWQSVTNGDSVYVYENLAGETDKAHALRLEVEAIYNNIPTVYRVYINENVTAPQLPGDPESSETTPADHLYAIRRNYEYRLEGNIKNIGEFDGLTLTANVLPWNRLSSEVNFKLEYDISPQPTAANHEYEVTGISSATEFTFKLNNPQEATWTAYLTNPFEFTFDGAHTGTTGSPVTITVKPTQGQGSNARTTEFYIAVNGVEIPLLEGNTSIGPGNRVVINQPENP